MSGAESELSLIDRAVAGDRVALSQLLLLHFDVLHQHVESRISHRLQGLMRADDILQQTFVRAAQAISTFEPRHRGRVSRLVVDHCRQPGAGRREASSSGAAIPGVPVARVPVGTRRVRRRE